MSNYPKVVALDTDWTIWTNFLDRNTWGKGPGASPKIEDNIERVDTSLLRDKTNHNKWIRAFGDISKVVNDILKNGAKLAIVSRNPSKEMCDRALFYYNTINPNDGKEWSIVHMLKYDEVVDESKTQHFRRIQGWANEDYSDMLMFDDEAFNNVVRIELGVTFQFLRDYKGLTWTSYQAGLGAWRRAKKVTIMTNPDSKDRRIIGYSGLPQFYIDLVQKRENIVDASMPARWGYALYVAPSSTIAKFFTDWNNSWNPDKSYVCEVWVKDYYQWVLTNKIWVPEHSTLIQMTNNVNWTAEETGRSQENRDDIIARNRWHPTPYVLFSRHPWMSGMPGPSNKRWSEMVVYTQIQRPLFEVVPLTDAQVAQITTPSPYLFDFQFKHWNILPLQETRQEFLRYGEKDLYAYSA